MTTHFGFGRALAVLAIAALAFSGGFLGGRARAMRAPDLTRFDALIGREAQARSLDPALLAAVVAAESGGNPEALSAVGAVGLCQLMPETAREEAQRLGISADRLERLSDPQLNVLLGASYLRRQLQRFEGDEVFALAAYNAGGTHVRRWQRRAPDVGSREAVLREGFAETRAYVARVLRLRDVYAGR